MRLISPHWWLSLTLLICVMPMPVLGEGEVEKHPVFKDRYKLAAQCLVFSAQRKKGTFYFPKVASNWEKEGAPWVYWLEGNELILFEPYEEGSPHQELIFSRRRLNLKKDVVETPDEVGTSTYLVDRAWATARIDEAKNGTKFIASIDTERNLRKKCSTEAYLRK